MKNLVKNFNRLLLRYLGEWSKLLRCTLPDYYFISFLPHFTLSTFIQYKLLCIFWSSHKLTYNVVYFSVIVLFTINNKKDVKRIDAILELSWTTSAINECREEMFQQDKAESINFDEKFHRLPCPLFYVIFHIRQCWLTTTNAPSTKI